ncbi:(2Fe-2S)-binding protein [Methylicorpusculum oleiharenae]|uniref:(2Fe-2S)-binding protein n=1 Tax=Methylicorpusculum oleiharenae TaxID=1338687 RepID=UPI001356C9A1|nr:(2Fe-2S)-binding protein [Methylicorpusculum oleiharenae]MCD2452206.1 (2Fe-2S)-binding protein [Methylicorpusculum oleiharenae]
MYICVCKAVTDGQLEAAIDSGLCSRKQLFQCFGVGGDCGKCNSEVGEILDRKRNCRLTKAANENLVTCTI